MRKALIVVGKAPQAGVTKTRLCPPLTPDQAASLYSAFLVDTVGTARSLGWARVTLVYPDASGARAILTRLLPRDVRLEHQDGYGLGEALRGAFDREFAQGFDRVVLIGSDNPTLPASLIRAADDGLDRHDVVIGPASDGGYYLIGMDHAHPALFEGITWSTSVVYRETLERARAARLSVLSIEEWSDVDTFADLARVRSELGEADLTVAPTTRAELRALAELFSGSS